MTDNLRDRVDSSVPNDVELFERADGIYGRDDHGEFKIEPMRGTAEPRDDRCGAVCKYTMERYGQTRYCGGMPESTFVEDGSQFCKHHKSRESLMERAQELFKHGYFAQNYINFASKLDATKFLFAVEIVSGLFEISTYDFEVIEETRPVETEDSEIIEEDVVEITLPIPQNTNRSFHANELWTAALKEVMTQNMQEAVFEEGMSSETISQTADMEGKITDTKTESVEHHLHLPISRLASDIKKHLENGGVDTDDEDGSVVTLQRNDYTMEVSPDEDYDDDDVADTSEVATDFSQYLEGDGDEIEVETE